MNVSEQLCTGYIKDTTVENNLLTIVGTMSICWGPSVSLCASSQLRLLPFIVDHEIKGRGGGNSRSFRLHWPGIDHLRFDFMRLATVDAPFATQAQWYVPFTGASTKLLDSWHFFPFTTLFDQSSRCITEGMMMMEKRTLQLKGRFDPFKLLFLSLFFFFFASEAGYDLGAAENKVSRG